MVISSPGPKLVLVERCEQSWCFWRLSPLTNRRNRGIRVGWRNGAGTTDWHCRLAGTIDSSKRELDRDARAQVVAAARTREDTICAQVSRIKKCTGDDKVKLRRWIRDVTTLHTTQPDVTVAVAEKTARVNFERYHRNIFGGPRQRPTAQE